MRKMLCTLAVIFVSAVSGGAQTPRLEVFGGYSYGRFNPGGFLTGDSSGKGVRLPLPRGWEASGQLNLNRWLGLVVDGASNGGANKIEGTDERHRVTTIMIGPQINLRNLGPFSIFAHGLGGVAHGHVAVKTIDENRNPITDTLNLTRPSFAIGGGIDVKLWRALALRLVQFDLVRTSFSNFASSTSNTLVAGRQNNARISTGIVIRLGRER